MKRIAPLLAFLLASCSGAQRQAEIKTGIDVTICVLEHVTDPPETLVTKCGATSLEDVLRILDAHKAAEVRESYRDAGP